MVINIMTRGVWQAVDPKMETPNRRATHVFWMNVKKTVCYTKVHCIELLKRSQNHNMIVQNQRDIRYNFMIGGDGNVYEGRGWGMTPLLPKEYGRKNNESVLIGFMGMFNTAKDIPTEMFQLGQDLVAYGIASDFIEKDFTFVDLINTQSMMPYDQQQQGYQPQRRYGGYQPNRGGGYQPSTYRDGGYQSDSYGDGGYQSGSYRDGGYQSGSYRDGGYQRDPYREGYEQNNDKGGGYRQEGGGARGSSRWYEMNLQ